MPPGGNDETLALGYLFLLQQLLERLRYRTDRGYADAARLIADFQADVAAQVQAGHIDGRILTYVGGALHQSKIPASPELAKASAMQHVNDREGWPDADDVHATLAGLLEACGDDPFVLVGSLVEFSHAMPAENRGALAAGLALCGAAGTRGAAVLLLLDPDRVVRRAVAESLLRSPPRYRRRRFGAWSQCAIGGPRMSEPKSTASFARRARPPSIARNGRRAVPKRFSLLLSMVPQLKDSCWCHRRAEKKRISSDLTKGGVADAWSGEPESPRRIEATLAESGMDAPMLAVSRSYLDRVLSHQLALSVERGVAAPLGLLQVAETLGGVDWQPARMDFGETLARLIAEIPEAMRGGTARCNIRRRRVRFTPANR